MCAGAQRTLGGFTASAAKGNKKASSTVAGNSDWGLLWGAGSCVAMTCNLPLQKRELRGCRLLPRV